MGMKYLCAYVDICNISTQYICLRHYVFFYLLLFIYIINIYFSSNEMKKMNF